LKTLLTITALFEGITGLSLLTIPTFFVAVLLGVSPVEPIGIFVTRLAGIALLALAIACWLYRGRQDADGVLKAMLFYNLGASLLLVYAWATGFSGIGIWPAAVVHLVLAVWCFKTIQHFSARNGKV
jgi:hypothetical protein